MKPKKLARELEKQLGKDPTNVVLRLRLAGALVQCGRGPEATEYYRSVAITYYAQGRIEQASAVCESILEIAPDHRETSQLLAELHALLARRSITSPPPDEPPASSTPRRRGNRPSSSDSDHGGRSDPRRADGGDGRSPGDVGGGDPQVGQSPPRRHRPVRSLAGVPPQRPDDASGARRRASSAPPPMPRGNSGRPGRDSSAPPGRRIDDLPLPPGGGVPLPGDRGLPLPPGGGRPTDLDDDNETRVAPGNTAPVGRSGVRSDTPVGLTTVEGLSARPPRSSSDDESSDDAGEVTIIDDGVSLARLLSPSLLAGVAGAPELPMLQGLPDRAIQAIAAGMVRREAVAGDLVVREGDIGESCYVVARGELRVLKRDPLYPRGDLIEVSRLGESAFFGELALLADRQRHATVQAVTSVEYYEIPRALIARIGDEVPEVQGFMARFYRERLLANLLATAPFFSPLAQPERAALARHFVLQRAAAGEAIIVEGTRAGGFYLLLIGAVELTRALSGDRTVLLATLGEGTYFGEMSLLRGDLARVSVVATRLTELALLPAKNLYALMASHPLLWDEVRREVRRRELDNVQMLAGTTGSV